MTFEEAVSIKTGISINKAQGMEGDRIVIDARVSPFMMGHTYVACSRVTSFKNIAILNTTNQVLDNAPTIVNVVYKELLTEHDRIIDPEVFTYDISDKPEEIQQLFKLCDRHIFDKLKYKLNSSSKQARQLVASMPLERRQEIYKLALGPSGGTSTTNHIYLNPRTNMVSSLNNTSSSSSDVNDPFLSRSDNSVVGSIIAMEPRVSIASTIQARTEQLERHMNLRQYTIEDVPGDGSCFSCSIKIS